MWLYTTCILKSKTMLHKKAHHVTRSEPFDKGGLDSCIITAYTAIVYKSYVIEGVVDYEKTSFA